MSTSKETARQFKASASKQIAPRPPLSFGAVPFGCRYTDRNKQASTKAAAKATAKATANPDASSPQSKPASTRKNAQKRPAGAFGRARAAVRSTPKPRDTTDYSTPISEKKKVLMDIVVRKTGAEPEVQTVLEAKRVMVARQLAHLERCQKRQADEAKKALIGENAPIPPRDPKPRRRPTLDVKSKRCGPKIDREAIEEEKRALAEDWDTECLERETQMRKQRSAADELPWYLRPL